jgi:hypothetical protein
MAAAILASRIKRLTQPNIDVEDGAASGAADASLLQHRKNL